MAYPLDPQEYDRARSFAESLEMDLRSEQYKAANLQDTIAKLQDDLRAQQVVINALSKKVFRAKAVVAPIRRLPFEVLGEVVCYLALQPDATPATLRDLSRVCRAWRHAAMNTPRAWANIRLTCNFNDQCVHRHVYRLDYAREWFERAGSCAKDVTIGGHPYQTREEHRMDAFLDLVAEHSPTIRTICIDGGAFMRITTSQRLMECLSRPMPLLQTLLTPNISTGGAEITQSVKIPTLTAWYGDYRVFDLSIQRQLRHIGISPLLAYLYHVPNRTTLQSLLADLQKSGILKQLLSLSFAGECFATTTTPLPEHRASADSLLSLAVSGDRDLQTLFEHVRAPNLRRLLVNCTDSNPLTKQVAAAFFARLVSPSAPPLQALYISGLSLPDADLLSLLRQLPLLRTFVAQDFKASNKVMEALSRPDYKEGRSFVGWLCPRLQRISICCKKSKNDKFRITRPAMESFAAARISAYMNEEPSPISRLQEVSHEFFLLGGLDPTERQAHGWQWVEVMPSDGCEEDNWRAVSKQPWLWIKHWQGATVDD